MIETSERKFTAVDMQIDEFEADVFGDMEKLKIRDERFLGIWTWISCFLYFIGWALGLLGSLYGTQGLVRAMISRLFSERCRKIANAASSHCAGPVICLSWVPITRLILGKAPRHL